MKLMLRLGRLFGAALALIATVIAADADWPFYLGDSNGTHYSSLRSINRENVSRLAPAWVFNTGDATATSQIQCNPIIVDGVLYGSTAQNQLFALDAATGHARWRFNPYANDPNARARSVNRGMVLWKQGDQRRILFTADSYLHAIDPSTGRLIESFGTGGRIDLHDGLDRDVTGLFVDGTTPGAVYRDLIIVGSRVGEGPGPAAPGHIRAYDVHTGKRRWIFHTIPWPGEFGHDTWPPDAWKEIGGANCWSGIVVDHERGLAFVPTGSPAFDFWGGNRIGSNLFSNSLIALDARTGERKWHFQFVHHDLWDYDVPAAPVLCELTREGKRIPAVVQITKTGHVWAFHRETGESLFPWHEQPAPTSDVTGEIAFKTQPVPLKPAPFARQRFTEEEVTRLTPGAHASVLARLRAAVPHQPYSPPSLRGTIVLPGFNGGGEWGGPAVDPDGILYVNSTEMAWLLQLIPTRGEGAGLGQTLYTQLCVACHAPDRKGNLAANTPSLLGLSSRAKPADVEAVIANGRGVMPAFKFLNPTQRGALIDFLLEAVPLAVLPSTPDRPGPADRPGELRTAIPYTITGYNRFLDPEGFPALRPPWGTLNAIDMNTGEYLWRRPLGEIAALTERGIPPTGTENYGGPLATAGGVVFVAATKDEKFRAFNSRTGELLWQADLPAGGYATPSTYAVDGCQYVVIACGGGKMNTKSGDAYVAFALPRDGEASPQPQSSTPREAAPAVATASGPTGTITVRVTDRDDRLLPARAWVETGDQRHFRPRAPAGCTPYQQDRSFSFDGWFEIEVPSGPVVVHVEKGKEFRPVNHALQLDAGSSPQLTVKLERWINLAEKGYYSADLHVHFGHDKPQVLQQLALADDVNLVPAFTYWHRGTEPAWPAAWPAWPQGAETRVDSTHWITRGNIEIERIGRRVDTDVAVGATFLFNLDRPLSVDRCDTRYPTNTALAQLAKASSPHSIADTDKPSWGESVIGAALGVFDVVQVCHNHYHRSTTLPGGWGMIGPLADDEKDLREPNELFHRTNTQYYHWLNCGIRLAATGGSAMGVMPVPLGFNRTYAKISDEFTPARFWQAVKAGRTFATSGPMLFFQAAGRDSGTTLHRSSLKTTPLEITAQLQSIEPIDAIELLENGKVIARETTPRRVRGEVLEMNFIWKVQPRRSSWYAARAVYAQPEGNLRQAHASPVYVLVDGKPIAVRRSAEYMLRWVDRLVEVAEAPGRYQTAAQRDEVLRLYRAARIFYEKVSSDANLLWGD